jgi:hypothetical protein
VPPHRFAVNRIIDDHVQLLRARYRGRSLDAALLGTLTAAGLPAGRRDPWTMRFYSQY